MAVNRTATRAGKQYETDLVRYLRNQGFDAERLRLAGVEDEGDLVLRTHGGDFRHVIEAKRCKALSLSDWVRQAQEERDNFEKHRHISGMYGFVVVHHARGKGIGQSYVTTTLDEWLGGAL